MDKFHLFTHDFESHGFSVRNMSHFSIVNVKKAPIFRFVWLVVSYERHMGPFSQLKSGSSTGCGQCLSSYSDTEHLNLPLTLDVLVKMFITTYSGDYITDTNDHYGCWLASQLFLTRPRPESQKWYETSPNTWVV